MLVTSAEIPSLILSVGVGAVAVLLIVWHVIERTRRETELSEEDERYFSRQAVRRWVVSATMVLLAIGLYAGSRMAPMVGGRPNVLFVQTWLWVIILLGVLVLVAMAEWVATRRYSMRQRKALLREGLELIRDEMRIRAALRTNGRPLDDPDQAQQG
jgi:membrane protein implicated in regulation of membrane protease activity